MPAEQEFWQSSDEALVDLQHRLATEADRAAALDAWSLAAGARIGACFVAFARGEAGPGRPGDRAWAAAVVWRRSVPVGDGGAGADSGEQPTGLPARRGDGSGPALLAAAVVAQTVPAAYAPGLLARREGPVLASAVVALDVRPDVLLVDATGRDHPRRAGLALHLGAATGIPTVGVTHRTLLASGAPPELARGDRAPVVLRGERVGFWVCTRSGVRPVVAHAGWRTSPETAAEVVLAASTGDARTPAPLREARRVAREARAAGGGGWVAPPGGRGGPNPRTRP